MSKVWADMAPSTSQDHSYNTRMLVGDSVHTFDNTTPVDVGRS